MSSNHSRNVSTDTTSSSRSGYQFILEHVMRYPDTYGDVPLRSMYAINCSAMGSITTSISPTSSTFPATNSSLETRCSHNSTPRLMMQSLESRVVAERFKTHRKDSSLPPVFITSFLNKVFPSQLECVDFPQALTALDYLKDLETRRRREQAGALSHLGIDPSVIDQSENSEDRFTQHPEASVFLKSLPRREKRADILYSQLYVALRRWAMLNTLYPPAVQQAPTSKLTVNMLMQQRDGFFRYIKAVDSRGSLVLTNLMKQGAKPGEINGWPAVKRTLSNYLNLTNAIITDSQFITNLQVTSKYETPSTFAADLSFPRSKTDSGFGFNTEAKHCKNSSTSSGKSTASHASSHASSISAVSIRSQSSTLERIAREFKRMRPRKLQVDESVASNVVIMPSTIEMDEEVVNLPTSATSDIENYSSQMLSPLDTITMLQTSKPASIRLGALKKMRSLGALTDLKHSNQSSSSLRSTAPPFDAAAMKKQRQMYDQTHHGYGVSVR